jgi:hypothetical protein
MIDLESLLKELRETGVVKIEITIRLSLESEATPKGMMHEVICKHCGWSRQYYDQSTALRGLRAHEHHCSAFPQQKHRKNGVSP